LHAIVRMQFLLKPQLMDDTPTTLLVAERDESLREFLVDQFLADCFAAHGAQSAEETRVKLATFHPDLLVLGELGRPHDPLGLLRGIRSRGDEH
jgi:DNA-binding response OmpR family regulator